MDVDAELARFAWPAAGSDRREERSRSGAVRARVEAGGGRLTLGELLADAWEGLLAAGSAPCPVCGGELERHDAAGRCGGCGSILY